MNFAKQLLLHTPVWVYLLLAYLAYQGVRALGPQTLTVRRMLAVPVLFVLIGLANLLAVRAGPSALLVWLAALLLATPLGMLTSPRLLAVDAEAGLVRRTGSVAPLVRNVGVFLVQYVVAVAAALHPVGQQHALLLMLGRAVSGATAGYFIGWVLAFRGQYRTAPRLALKAA